MRKYLFLVIAVAILSFLFSYKLLDVPTNFTVDDAVFGYNAALIAKTAHDSNGRFLPVFVLTTGTSDWHQPVTQYFLVALFKIFGPSVFLLRFSSVLVAVFSVLIFYLLAAEFLRPLPAVIAALIFTLTPQLLIQAHMAQENIMPLPFVILWLLGLVKFNKNQKLKWLVISAVALGISFYSYKGMRAIAPVWVILSLIYLRKVKPVAYFVALTLPFYLIIPVLEHFYAGAILDNARPVINNVYDFFAPYLSTFDLSYLFVHGDTLLIHSTQRHGMLLLASLPLILIGVYQSVKTKNFRLVLIALILGPVLYGLVGSEHRYSRLMALIPFFVILAGLGWQTISESKNKKINLIAPLAVIFIVINFLDFYRYYLTDYPPLTYAFMGTLQNYQDVAKFRDETIKRHLDPVVQEQVSKGGGDTFKFFQMVYFGRLLPVVADGVTAPTGSILLSNLQEIPGMVQINNPKRIQYTIQIPDK